MTLLAIILALLAAAAAWSADEDHTYLTAVALFLGALALVASLAAGRQAADTEPGCTDGYAFQTTTTGEALCLPTD